MFLVMFLSPMGPSSTDTYTQLAFGDSETLPLALRQVVPASGRLEHHHQEPEECHQLLGVELGFPNARFDALRTLVSHSFLPQMHRFSSESSHSSVCPVGFRSMVSGSHRRQFSVIGLSPL